MNSPSTISAEDLLAHSAWLQRLARRLTDPSTADDLVQETWAAAVRTQPDRSRPLRPWLAEVLRNLVRMRARGASRWQARAQKIAAADEAPLPSPEELFNFHEAQRLVAEAVTGLEEPYRSTVLLCYAQEIPPGEIARRQGIPGGTVRWRLKRGLEQLRATLDARYGNDRHAWCLMLAPLTGREIARTAAGAAAGAMGVAGVRGLAGRMGARLWRWQLGAAAATAAIAVGAWLLTGPPAAAPAPERARLALARVPHLVVPEAARPAELAPGGPAAAPGPGGGGTNPAAVVAAAPATAEDLAQARRRAIEPGDSPGRGNPRAPVTVVIWSEFQCPFCARAVTTLRQLEAAYPDQLRLVWKHLPLAFHESAFIAAEASLAAHEQGKFWQMHDRLFEHQNQLDIVSLSAHAKAIGLDVAAFTAALETSKHRKRVEADVALAKEANITGAPTFFINGEELMGAQPLDVFQKQVERALALVKGLPAPEAPVAPLPGAKPSLSGNPYWPPPPIVLSEGLLGDRVKIRFTTGSAPMRGSARAPVEVLYFTTLAVQQARLMMEGLLETYRDNVRVIVKVVPAVLATEGTPLYAEAALYAQGEGKFWAFHDAFRGNEHVIPDRPLLDKIAASAGLDVADLGAALADGRFRATALAEKEEMLAARIGRFGFVVDGRKAESPVALAQLIDAALVKAGRRPPARAKVAAVPISPSDPQYNVQGLFNYLTAHQLFHLEPRDDAWAGAIEKSLLPLMARDLTAVEPKAGGFKLECRSTLCRLHWPSGPVDRLVRQSAYYLFTNGPMARGDSNEAFAALRPNTSRSADESLAQVKGRRATVLFNHRTGRQMQPPPFPVDRMPKE